MYTDITLDEYADPTLYDQENHSFEPDGPFYLELARRYGGPVLELGCGTGRVTIPLAQQGIEITGLDIVPGMLERARSKAGDLPITWVEGDARAFQLGRRFHLIFESGAMFQHLLERTDQEALFTTVREHLDSGGYLVIAALFPTCDLLTDRETEQEWFSYVTDQGQHVRVTGTYRYDRLRQVRTETAFRHWTGSDGQAVVKKAPMSHWCQLKQHNTRDRFCSIKD